MSSLKLVFVPRWLDRVAKEVGISNADLFDLQKLGGILSQRDVELYQMANFNLVECLVTAGGISQKDASDIVGGFGSPLSNLSLEKRAAYANVDIHTFIYGATATVDGEDMTYSLCVEIGDQDTLFIRVCPKGEEPESFLKSLTKTLHSLMSFRDFASTFVFKQYVRELQINSVV